jgi:hypothetical protein
MGKWMVGVGPWTGGNGRGCSHAETGGGFNCKTRLVAYGGVGRENLGEWFKFPCAAGRGRASLGDCGGGCYWWPFSN